MNSAKLDATQFFRLQQAAQKQGYTMDELTDHLLNTSKNQFFIQSTALLCTLNLDGHILAVNPAFCDALETTADVLINQPLAAFTHVDDHPHLYAMLANPQTEHTLEVRLHSARQADFWVEFVCSAAQAGTFYLTGQDITDRKQQDADLTATNQQFVTMLERVSDAFFAVDHQWCFTYLNSHAEMQLFRDSADLIGRSIWDEFPQAIGTTFYVEYQRAMREQIAVTFTEYYPPLERWFEVNAYPSKNGISVYFRNVTDRIDRVALLEDRVRERTLELVATNLKLQMEIKERHAIEQTLREEEERFRLLTESTSDMICLHEPDGTYLYVSPASIQLIGYAPEELIGKNPYTFFHDNDKEIIQTRSHSVSLDGNSSYVAYRFRRKDGEYIWFETNTRPIIDDAGHVTQLVTSSRDIGLRKELETELVAALQAERQASEMRQHFFGMLSHEFRVPLATILSSADLVRLYVDRMTEDQRNTHFFRIQSQVHYLTTMVDTIIELSKAETIGLSFDPTPTDIEQSVEDIIVEMQPTAHPHHSLNYHPGVNCGLCDIDDHLLRMILTNLISNATRYSPQSGQIDITLACDRAANTLSIRVEDYGIGIPQDNLDRIFDYFARGSNVGDIKGSGLGLQLTYLCVKAHKGTIEVESTVDVGTVFTVILPMRQN